MPWFASLATYLTGNVAPSAIRSNPADTIDAADARRRTRLRARACRSAIGLGITLVVVAIGFIPYPYRAGGPFTLVPAARVEVRAELEGLVDTVLVREGQWVDAGAPIARLSMRVQERNR